MCIAPVLLGKIYNGIICIIGNNSNYASVIENGGGSHKIATVNKIVLDEKNKIITK